VERIQFEQVSKRYTVGDQLTAREAMIGGARKLLGRTGDTSHRELWSLRDVSFTASDGEALGIVGRNGAGKSTILKILTRITAPTSGVSRTRGRVAALLEVGTGFHPELTGRENIYLNGAILGMSRSDIARAFDAIVDFSGVARFLDTPVKRYSSGMGLRLGFSVAAHLDPDVLVVDEILAVGDAEFQRKCLGRMEEAEHEGRTVVFVSHDLDALAKLCTRAIWLESGQIRQTGRPDDVVRHYLTSGLMAAGTEGAALRSGPVTIRNVRVMPIGRPADLALMRDDPLRIEVEFELSETVPDFDLAIYLTTPRGVRVLDEALSDTVSQRLTAGAYCARIDIPSVLNVGDFSVGIWCGTHTTDFLDESAATHFALHGSDRGRPARAVVLDLPISISSL
jgi:ABC-2 type transport system ATP-binding protein/lipopolysaccharide transport system ATP-binding protein